MKALNNVPMPKVEKTLSPMSAYSNSLTRRCYAGILLSSSKGLLYLSSLMKRGKFPMSDEVLKLTLLSRKTGETKTVTVHPQQTADWGTDDLINRVEGRSSQILPADETPEAYAAAYGWKFEESKPGVSVMTVPSWVGAVNSD